MRLESSRRPLKTLLARSPFEMEESVAGRIGEQHAAYRKGLVLGLTMAEVGILIIFVLLLLIAFEEIKRQALVRENDGKVAIETDRLARLTEGEAVLQAVAKE